MLAISLINLWVLRFHVIKLFFNKLKLFCQRQFLACQVCVYCLAVLHFAMYTKATQHMLPSNSAPKFDRKFIAFTKRRACRQLEFVSRCDASEYHYVCEFL